MSGVRPIGACDKMQLREQAPTRHFAACACMAELIRQKGDFAGFSAFCGVFWHILPRASRVLPEGFPLVPLIAYDIAYGPERPVDDHRRPDRQQPEPEYVREYVGCHHAEQAMEIAMGQTTSPAARRVLGMEKEGTQMKIAITA